MDLESLLVSLYVLVDDWWREEHSQSLRRPGRPTSLSSSEVLTLAILSQWPRWRSERDFYRYADVHLREYFPNLLSYGQLNRRIRALELELKAFQREMAARLADGSEVYHILDTTLIPAVVRVRACRKGLFAGQAAFGRCVSKTEWIYGFKVALSVTPEGVIMAFGLAEANSDERKVGEFLLSSEHHDVYLADKGFSSVAWEKHWSEIYGALVAATPQESARRAWPEQARRWAAGKRQLIEGVIDQLKDIFPDPGTPKTPTTPPKTPATPPKTSSPTPKTPSPAPKTPTPVPKDSGTLMNAGGPTTGPMPMMPNGSCPREFPEVRDGACYSG